jgi:hypothetical protein
MPRARATKSVRERLRALVNERDLNVIVKEIGVGREALTRILADLPVLQSTITVVTQYVDAQKGE